jgi:hypothetical protein
MPRINRESDTEEDDDRKIDESTRPPDRDDGDEYAEPERVSRRADAATTEIEAEELAEDDIMEELDEDDLRGMDGPDA